MIAYAFFKCLKLLLLYPAFHEHIIYIYFHRASNQVFEHFVHQPLASIMLNRAQPAVKSTRRSIRGKGYGSFGQALLRSVKSVYIRHFLEAFGTITTFDSQFI
ncbi:UNVERIFIED_CONTAM: hypothetical protein Slati_0837100 [Sesamum latifolium]|uniref:Secreted protein n=1 Tax=Sesamum latifolium TaxID=2727402 RepID=A0AAW2XP89_9LAMI